MYLLSWKNYGYKNWYKAIQPPYICSKQALLQSWFTSPVHIETCTSSRRIGLLIYTSVRSPSILMCGWLLTGLQSIACFPLWCRGNRLDLSRNQRIPDISSHQPCWKIRRCRNQTYLRGPRIAWPMIEGEIKCTDWESFHLHPSILSTSLEGGRDRFLRARVFCLSLPLVLAIFAHTLSFFLFLKLTILIFVKNGIAKGTRGTPKPGGA